LLQYDVERLKKVYSEFFSDANDILLAQEENLDEKFKILGELVELSCNGVEPVYGSKGSTQAYETFGPWHLIPSNPEVDLTATSPGVVLATEADPIKYAGDDKNLIRSTYFDMLRSSIKQTIGSGRRRLYFASEPGTRAKLQQYQETDPKLIEASKEILQKNLELGKDVFQIRIGTPNDSMRFATLVGDMGVVYYVRDGIQKKIAHNVTVWDQNEGGQWREQFMDQWNRATPLDNIDMIDNLAKK
jgi:hypothetical protein